MSTTDRGIVKLLKRVEELGNEIKQIANTGLSALTASSERNTFLGMHHTLDRVYDRFCDKWTQCLDYAEERSFEQFPEQSHTIFIEEVKHAYYNAHGYYEQLRKTDRSSYSGTFNIAKPTLPPISIKPFTGNISDWLHFKQVFTAIVLDDPTFSDIERFKYLLTYVEGQAHDKIKTIPVLATNFSQAWKCLDDLYSNERKLACHYLDRLLNYKFPAGKPTFDHLQSYQSQVAEIIQAFKGLKIPASMDLGEYLLCELAVRVMDPSTREGFENYLANNDSLFPSLDNINKYIDRRCRVLSVQTNETSPKPSIIKPKYFPGRSTLSTAPSPKTSLIATSSANSGAFHSTSATHPPCYICRRPHPLFKCSDFYSFSPQARIQSLKDWSGCRNCLYTSHRTRECPSKIACRECQKRHHTLLHFPHPVSANIDTPAKSFSPMPQSHSAATASTSGINNTFPQKIKSDFSPKARQLNSNCMLASANYDVLLGTATARIQDQQGSWHPVRLVVDCGSQSSFITEDFVAKLGLSLQPASINITGIGQSFLPSATAKVYCKIQPASKSDPVIITTALVVPKITPPLPSDTVPVSVQEFFRSFELADPAFANPGPIELLIGADLYPDLITGAPISVNANLPRLIPTIFGYLLMGPYHIDETNSPANIKSFLAATHSETSKPDLGELMTKFWELEDVPSAKPLTPAEQAAETHFKDMHYRLPCGRYVVGLAFKDGQPSLGPSKTRAQNRFYNLEKTLCKWPDRKASYRGFLKEYEELGHLSKSSVEGAYYIPHHAVYKLDNKGVEKIRVVFDGSAKTSLGSLNDFLLVGPKLQQDVCIVLLNFRRHCIVFIADIVKMFRQILIKPEDRKFQHILWRDDPSLPLEDLELNTITYGLASSPYLSLRVLRQLAEDEGSKFPQAAHILLDSCYVDDLNGGASTVSEALLIQQQLIKLLDSGGFCLGKWASNRPELLDAVEATTDGQLINLQDSTSQDVGILGLQWDPARDILTYKVQQINFSESRRSILSIIARLYDPLGLLAPVIFHAKMIMQDTWQYKDLSWDDPVPANIAHRWLSFAKDLPSISHIELPRYISNPDCTNILFVGFCDASSKGYCAAMYMVTYSTANNSSQLLKSKTKLAPLKPLITIPRLELCGALLLTRLYRSLLGFMKHFPTAQTLFFTDSSNVLGWLSTPVNNLLTFAAHRVSEILQFTTADQWRHVRSEYNSADLGSRGLLPSQLRDNTLWWNGPWWLSYDPSDWPVSSVDLNRCELPELKKNIAVVLAVASEEKNFFLDWIERFPGGSYQFPKLVRIIAYIKRFAHHCKGIHEIKTERQVILPSEYNQAQTTLFSIVQADAYPKAFENGLASTAFLRSLNVFLDDSGIIRVGGRLKNSSLNYNAKHPILLPRCGRLTEIIVRYYHYKCLHAGSAAVLHAIQQTYWLPGGRNLVKRIQRSCPICLRFNSQPRTPFMADLPANRINIANPFSKIGIDYAGPFLCKSSHLKKAPVIKVYLCLFICLVTKAVHLEVAYGLSTEAFLDAFERFAGRRGLPTDVLSDCGTNFKGASNYIQEIQEWHSNLDNRHQILSYALPNKINWSFIVPHSPHFGGIWESQIKSAKTLLRKLLGAYKCTAEELNTMFIRIEAIMNSRPLYAMSTDPRDLETLTPAHFLIGRSLIALPEPDFTKVPENHLRTWQGIRQRTQMFWDRWTREYLQTLQARQKWHTHRPNLQINDMVLIAEDGTAPLHWPLGRIMDTSPGADGVVRVVKIVTAQGQYTRPVAKIVRLVPYEPHPASD